MANLIYNIWEPPKLSSEEGFNLLIGEGKNVIEFHFGIGFNVVFDQLLIREI